jgi:hypothetical protein
LVDVTPVFGGADDGVGMDSNIFQLNNRDGDGFIWANYNDRTLFSRTLESWSIREIIPKWP